jgi:hypothetical protein
MANPARQSSRPVFQPSDGTLAAGVSRANRIRCEALLSVAYVSRMACVTEGVVKRYEDGTLEASRPNGASASSLIKRLDVFYEWMEKLPKGGELP